MTRRPRRSLAVRAAAVAAGAALVAAVAGPARAEAESGAPLPDLPWSLLATVVDGVDLALRPLTGMSPTLLEASGSIAPLAPLGHLLGVAGAALPTVADGMRLVAQVDEVDLGVRQVSASGEPPAWQVPALPDLTGSVALLTSGAQDLQERITAAVDCDCLPFGLTERLAALQPQMQDASWALDAFAPVLDEYDELTGFTAPRTYLVVIGNQAEMRPSGGAPLYAAVVTADDGLVTVVDKGATSSHFFPPMNRPVTWTGVASNPYFANNPRTGPFVNAGAHPDFSVSGQELAAAFAAGGHPSVDGVVFVDLTFLAEVLRLTGPVTVDGIGTVDADNLATQLLDNAYDQADSPEENARRQAANDALVDALLARVAQGLPAMAALQTLDSALGGRHLQVWFRDPAAQETFDALGWTGRLVAPADADWLAWFTQSGNPSKTDIRQDRSATRTVTVSGSSAEVVTDYVVANRNAPSSDPTVDDRRGYQATWMKTAVMVYLPPAATDVRVVGLSGMKPAPLKGVPLDGDVMTDAAGNRFLRFSSWIPPLEDATIRIAYRLPLAAAGSYSVVMEPQLSITPYTATVTVDDPEGTTSFGPAPVDEQIRYDARQ